MNIIKLNNYMFLELIIKPHSFEINNECNFIKKTSTMLSDNLA